MADEFTKAALYGIKTFNKKVKEKIGMQKLIELLNEWKGKSYIFYMPDGADKVHRKETDAYGNMHVSCIKNCELISKEFDFIKWLVENDKIDQKGVEYKFQDVLFELEEEEIVKEKSDFLIMLLSISSSPIDDLISYLK